MHQAGDEGLGVGVAVEVDALDEGGGAVPDADDADPHLPSALVRAPAVVDAAAGVCACVPVGGRRAVRGGGRGAGFDDHGLSWSAKIYTSRVRCEKVYYTGGVPVTRDDVARAAGVSVATVSYVLNGGPRPVSEERRRRVLEAVAELGYRPNAIARSLRARRTRILGLVLPDSANPYFAALSHAIEEAATARGYQVIIANAAERPEREAAHIEALLRLQVDGLFWIPADLRWPGGSRGGSRSRRAGPCPTVQVDRTAAGRRTSPGRAGGPGRRWTSWRPTTWAGAGWPRRTCWTWGTGAWPAWPGRRGTATPRPACRASARPSAGPAWRPPGGPRRLRLRFRGGHRRAVVRLPQEQRPTGIVCGNDAMAIGALGAIAGAGLRVPQDVSVTGYDDLPQAPYTVPPLTTVAQPVGDLATAAVERLLARIERPQEARPAGAHRLPRAPGGAGLDRPATVAPVTLGR